MFGRELAHSRKAVKKLKRLSQKAREIRVCVERYSQKYSLVVPSLPAIITLDAQMVTKSDVFSNVINPLRDISG